MCEYYPVVCEYCGKKIPKKDIEYQESTTCDEVPTECDFQAIGCNHNKVRIFGLFKMFMHVNKDISKYTTTITIKDQIKNYIQRL